ncbi:hypothetical protein SLEP1_g54449 [Rubroshorea leprosula]|uniref:non-specific serine/threonine protein kinase n=1 Tax=Rubroshorea leprosula TaxID=152421 RepID=A0AAV5MCN9_9ROSI|nr:hypothetical protein SLEP1_g54449 [Rubroshorea leprosula]
MLTGEIAQELGRSRVLETLNLSHDMLNISYNQSEGPIPPTKGFLLAPFEALRNNKGLCENAIGLPQCVSKSQKKSNIGLVILIITPVLGVLSLLVILVGFLLMHYKKSEIREWQFQDIFATGDMMGKSSMKTFLKLQSNSTLTIALVKDMEMFTKPDCQQVELLRSRNSIHQMTINLSSCAHLEARLVF